METHVLGFPRIGAARELKFALERYWRGDLTATALKAIGRELKLRHWAHQRDAGLSLVTVGDFSFYDQVLDMALMLSLVPPRFASWQEDNALDLAFRMARGDAASNTPALDMTKWFDTNYHYIVPELSPGMAAQLREDVVLELLEDADLARAHGLHTKAVLLGPITFMTLCRPIAGLDRWTLLPGVLSAYADLVRRLAVRCKWIQLDEPVLCMDMTPDAQAFFLTSCKELRRAAGDCPVLLTTYFGELGENLTLALGSGCAALHLDGVRARQEIDAVVDRLPQGMRLSLGLVDGRNIWKTDLVQARTLAARAVHKLGQDRVMLGSSCSLLHCPVDVTLETTLPPEITRWMAFAVQKCQELTLLRQAIEGTAGAALAEHSACLAERRASPLVQDPAVRQRVAAVEPAMLQRTSPVQLRKARQREVLGLPLLPTTTIGSFPQTAEIRKARLAHRRGEMSSEAYESFLKETIAQVIAQQEALGLDVLVHGESERNDMVEYFGQMLKGFCFTANGWVQSYGSRCVKPPVIVGDVSRPGPMTVPWIVYAQSLTQKPVKGMLTGPVTILNWSFVRDDVPREDVCRQLALAVRDEVQDLERAGVSIIQIDEAAFREGMPLARAAQEAYLSWAVECFRLASAGVRDETQIHTHMCYSEFDTIIPWIAAMDADVISIESSRSSMTLLDVFTEFEFPYDIGPGVYDIHSPRVPAVEEMAALLRKALAVLPADRVWVNPDCGLKTRAWPETMAALANMVAAAHRLRDEVRAQAS
ncbi:MAG: 5-methyltetrahydropteroyltriglutamate--homocysteine S-methyltransferase [Desulfovibrio sp.]|nr:5-methyltetrahydropteroyltriglutamate--homocysteine S-methyltransferase [Desulfovibrio sp.]